MLNYLVENYGISTKEIKALEENFVPFSYEKGEIIDSIGEIFDKIYFISSGSMRTFYINEERIEVSRRIYFENDFCTNWESFRMRSVSRENIQALENVKGVYITYERVWEQVQKNPCFKDIYVHILERFQEYHMKKYEFIVTLSAEERMKQIDSYFPNLKNRVTDKVLASFMRISPQHLCRVKRKILGK